MTAFVSVDLTVRKRIAAEEMKNPRLHIEKKRRIKEAIYDLLNRLNIEIRLKDEDPYRYRMKLYFGDYPGAVVLSEKVERVFGVFRRSYSRYVSIPSGKRKSEAFHNEMSVRAQVEGTISEGTRFHGLRYAKYHGEVGHQRRFTAHSRF